MLVAEQKWLTHQAWGLLLALLILTLTIPLAANETEQYALLKDGTLLTVIDFSFDGKHYQLETRENGKQSYTWEEVLCIGSSCNKQQPAASSADPTKIESANKQDTFDISTLGATQLNFHGSSTIGELLMPSLIEAYAKANNWTIKKVITQPHEKKFLAQDEHGIAIFNVDLQTYGSSTGFQDLLNEDTQLAMSSRTIRDKEYQAMLYKGFDSIKEYSRENILALDGLVIIVHPDNPINYIELEMLSKIYAGETQNWNKISEMSGKIRLYFYNDNSGSKIAFNDLVMEPYNKTVSTDTYKVDTGREIAEKVSKDINGIGAIPFAVISNEIKTLPLVNECGMYFEPDEFLVKTEEYPLSRRLFLYKTDTPKPALFNDFMQYILSDKAIEAIRKVGFVDQKPMRIPLNQQGQRISEFFSTLNVNAKNKNLLEKLKALKKLVHYIRTAERTSITLRFREDGFKLDNKAQADLQRLIPFLKSPDNRNFDIALLGFTNARSTFNVNRQLSLRRVKHIANILKQQGIKVAVQEGYGELAPIACQDGRGRYKNNRVEVWLINKDYTHK